MPCTLPQLEMMLLNDMTAHCVAQQNAQCKTADVCMYTQYPWLKRTALDMVKAIQPLHRALLLL